MSVNNDIPLAGKTILVTGATGGIGELTALELADQGAEVIIVSRNPEKCAMKAADIRRKTGNPKVDFFSADLSSQTQIHQFVDQFQTRYQRLDVLINNVGAFFISRQTSVDGIEKTFALNHLSYFLVANLLLDTLKASAPARVVNVSSNAHFNAALDFDDLQFEHGYSPFKAYARSKFANLLFTYELARHLEGTGVTANALHPGLVKTDIGKNASWWLGLGWRLMTLIRGAKTPQEGAQTSVYLASSPEVKGVSGKYFANQRAVPSDPATYDQSSARHLWEISARMVGLEVG